MNFPRLDKGSVPRASGRAVSAITTSRGAETDGSESLAGEKGGSDRKRGRGIVGNTSDPFPLTKRDVIVAGVGASVSPRHLIELFFAPRTALKQPTQLSECGPSSLAAESVVTRFPNSDPPGSNTDNVFEECGLFDDLAPEGLPREGWSPKRLVGGNSLSVTASPKEPERRENLIGKDTIFHSPAMVAAVETAIESSNWEKPSPVRLSSNRLGSPKYGQCGKVREDGSQSGEREASLDTRCASVDELQPLVVDGETERDAVVTMTTREQGVPRGETGGTGRRGRGGGTVGSRSAPEPQVGAISGFCGISLHTKRKLTVDVHRAQAIFLVIFLVTLSQVLYYSVLSDMILFCS